MVETEHNISSSWFDSKLLERNRERCCVCRNPSKDVKIHSIGNRKYKYDPDGQVVICSDCYRLALQSKQDFGEEFLKSELSRYKDMWEIECDAWRNSPSFSIRIRQGDLQEEGHGFGEILVDWYYCSPDSELYIDMTSDEPVSFLIHKQNHDGGMSLRTYFKSGIAYEFNTVFIPKKPGFYALIIRRESSSKTTMNLRSPALLAARDKANAERVKVKANLVSQEKAPLECEITDSNDNSDYIPWKILPPGEHPFPHIMEHCDYLIGSRKGLRIAKERLELINSLNPTKTYKGLDEFNGYFVFYFEYSGIAILDCPIVGNAIYIIKGDWKILSRLSKAELLKQHANNVTRVIHSGIWFDKIEKLIKPSL